MQGWGRTEVLERLRPGASPNVRGGEAQGGDGCKVALGLAAALAEAFEAVDVPAVVLQQLDLLLEADEMVEPRDLRRGVERGRVVQEADEVERAREAVGFARVLDELDEVLVKGELARSEVGSRKVVAEAVAEDVE